MYAFIIYLSCLSLMGSCLRALNQCEAARILAVLPTPSFSHQVVFRPLTQELAKRGHEVTVITTDPAFPKGHAPSNLIEIDLHDISYKTKERQGYRNTAIGKKKYLNYQLELIFSSLNEIFENQLQTKEFQEILKKRKDYFDLLILELCVNESLVLSHIFEATVIQISSFGARSGSYELMGGPTHPLHYPVSSRQRLNNLTLTDKLTELYSHYSNINMFEKIEKRGSKMLRRHFGPDIPDLSKLKENVDMLFLNMHPLLEGNFPVPQTVQYIWGIHRTPEKELPEDLKRYLNSSKLGVIYMSFGSNMDPTLLAPEKIQVFVKVFEKLPYDVLWKWNGDELPGCPDNVKIGKWFPQSDLLRHQKLKLFVTQGGLQSIDEAITAGVPLVGVPMWADQWYNVEKCEQHKIGLKIDFETLTEETLGNAITNVMNDDNYRENIVRLRSLMRDQPQTPLERAVWWTEHVLRHAGAEHLRAPAANMHWTRYYEVELVLTLLGCLIAFVAVSVLIIYKLCSFVKTLYRVEI